MKINRVTEPTDADLYAVWPDGDFCQYEGFDYEGEWSHKSDDYSVDYAIAYTEDGTPLFTEAQVAEIEE